jgi:hypothetical protein
MPTLKKTGPPPDRSLAQAMGKAPAAGGGGGGAAPPKALSFKDQLAAQMAKRG